VGRPRGFIKGGQYGPFLSFLIKQGQEVMCWSCGSPHMKKECPKNGNAITSTSSNA